MVCARRSTMVSRLLHSLKRSGAWARKLGRTCDKGYKCANNGVAARSMQLSMRDISVSSKRRTVGSTHTE
jgi:hypothetical protein